MALWEKSAPQWLLRVQFPHLQTQPKVPNSLMICSRIQGCESILLNAHVRIFAFLLASICPVCKIMKYT